MYIERVLKKKLLQQIEAFNKVIILYGARQVGKTTLIKKLISDLPFKTLSVNGDEQKYLDVLSSKDLKKLKSLVSGYELIFIDEAQRIPEIGLNLKILVDNLPKLKIIATGSSSFDLANKISEPLTGRAWTHTLYPISILELKEIFNQFQLNDQLEERLLFGSYPEIFLIENHEDKKLYLNELNHSYLYKDIFELASIKHSNKIRDLLKLLAFQIGMEVSVSELATQLEIAKTTVDHYIDLLEKSFVLCRLSGFSRNLRKEVSKMDKIYFYDLGVRNAVIDNFKSLKERNDVGQLWENFLVVERMKCLAYKDILATSYFWRTYTGAELDYLEETEGKLFGYEFKWNNKKVTAPKTWLNVYPNANFNLINSHNWVEFVSAE